MSIHPSSIVSKQAELASDVYVGPFCIINGRARIESGTRLESHVVVGCDNSIVEIGKNNVIYAGAYVGGPPQDLKYKGEVTKLIVGDANVIREYSTINVGTVTGAGQTKIGSHNLLMSYVHVGHDCEIGDHNAIASTTVFGGHVHVGNQVKIGGMCAFNQFVRVGDFAFVAGCAVVNKDLLPFSMNQGNYAVARASNKIGMERAGYSESDINTINRAMRILLKGTDTIEEALARIAQECEPTESLKYFVEFIKTSQRGLAK